nr:DUF262 domain-containing protein [Nitrosomonas nitrosa]
MKDAQKPDHVSLMTLIGRLKDGRFVIPDFQREFEWKPWDVRDLMRSIFLDYYIGSLLLWKGKENNFEALACEQIYGFTGKENREHIVLDGQQRLTAMYYAFMAPDKPLPNRTNRAVYYVQVDKFMAEEYDVAFQYDWFSRRVRKILTDRTAQFAEHIFPFSIIGAGGWELPNWVQDYEKYWREREKHFQEEGNEEASTLAAQHAENAEHFGQHLRELTEQYQVAYIELDKDLEIDKICDIFTQINSKGIRLDIFDLVNALLKPKGLQLKHMWREAASRLEFVDSEKMNVYILQVMSIIRQSYCSPKYLYFLLPGQEKSIREPDGARRKEVLVRDIKEFEALWESAVDALELAIKSIRHPQEFGVISPQYLPYVSILPAFAALQAHIRTLPANRRLDAQRKVRHWYWASVFMNRYSGSVESTTARDYLDLKQWFLDDASEPSLIDEFKRRFRNLDLRKEIKKGTSVYNGIFNLLVIQGARDWVSGAVPQHDDLDDHHIVPESWGKKNLPPNAVHTILNRTPLSGDTNRQIIGSRLPNEYLPDWIEQNGEKNVRAILESHFVSPAAFDILLRDPFGPEDFDAFISERQRTLQAAIEDLLVKERLDLAPNLREIDANIEAIELKLRTLIASALNEAPDRLPGAVQENARDRVEKAARKSASFDEEKAASVAGLLEFCDLRELETIMATKSNWGLFEPIFRSKDAMIKKFDQLAELRNGIRHSRTVDEITAKEGEAAILWFQTKLA